MSSWLLRLLQGLSCSMKPDARFSSFASILKRKSVLPSKAKGKWENLEGS